MRHRSKGVLWKHWANPYIFFVRVIGRLEYYNFLVDWQHAHDVCSNRSFFCRPPRESRRKKKTKLWKIIIIIDVRKSRRRAFVQFTRHPTMAQCDVLGLDTNFIAVETICCFFSFFKKKNIIIDHVHDNNTIIISLENESNHIIQILKITRQKD